MKTSFAVRIAGGLAGAALVLLGAAAMVTWSMHRREVDPVPDQQKIARSLEIIRTSTPADRKVLKVLFYGQSVTRSGWDKAVVEHWRQRYPNTVFVVQNLALGGFASQTLVRAAARDVADFYPDLIVFHVYGDHRAYEQILRIFRSQTAADIVVQTDHGEVLPDPPCAEGLQLSLSRQPGCAGLLWVKQREWHDEMSYHKIPAFARKYGLAMEPQRTWWRDYLLRAHIDPRSLLADEIHPNDKGKALIAAFFNRYFDTLVDAWSGQTESTVATVPESAAQHSPGHESFSFDGNRVELISNKPLQAFPKVAIDGVSTQEIDGCYEVTRASSIETVPDWPSLRRITLHHDRVAEDWTATLTHISGDESSFQFTVAASKSGAQGSGDSAHDFAARSGLLSFEADDWMVERAFDLRHIPLPDPFPVHWSVRNVCAGDPEAIDLGGGAWQYRYILGTGLANGPHSATLSWPSGEALPVQEFRVYRPPIRE